MVQIKSTRKKRHLQINKKRKKRKRKKHAWLTECLHIEGRLNEGPRLQRKHSDEKRSKTKQTNVTPEKTRHGICRRNARRIQVRATCGSPNQGRANQHEPACFGPSSSWSFPSMGVDEGTVLIDIIGRCRTVHTYK